MASSFGFEPGTVIGESYRVIDSIGRGGMGVVLRARDERLERDVAIKLIRPELLNDDLRERFVSEARAMARVQHPNVLPIYAFGEHQGAPYFVTRIVKGKTVEAFMREHRAKQTLPDLETAFAILEGTCKGVAAIHAAGTVHRDLKPSNLLMDDDGSICVCDMGVSVLVEAMSSSRRSGEMIGTPHYMAPESVDPSDLPAELVHRADIYAIACLAYELFTGSTPFASAPTLVACILAHLNDPPPRASALRAGLPEGLDEALLAALAKAPQERTPTADAFHRALVEARTKAQRPARILVAEDDEDFRELLNASLHRDFPDAAIEAVGNGKEALEAIGSRPPSVAILDLNMPEMSGMQLIEHLRARAIASNVPIVVLTGSGGPQEWKHLSELGAEGFLVKPVNVRDVAPLVTRVLSDRARTTTRMPPAPVATPAA